MFRAILFLVLFVYVICDEEYRTVVLDIGTVAGQKYWDGDFYEFYGIKYATAPKGRDRFKAPLPVEPWKEPFSANLRNIICEQIYLTDDDDDELILDGTDDCLALNLLVPKVASENNLVPVIVYVHSGAFAGGSSNMARLHYLARHDVIVVSFNYRIGAIGFACLGTEDIPGNAGLKDQIAALKWINKYIRKFGGDPNRVTLAGFSVGASMAELLALSKATDGLVHGLILESGSALSPFTINRNPIDTAKNFAISIGFNGTSMEDLNEFLLNAPIIDIAEKSKNFFLPNSTFGLAPCIERADSKDAFLTESPLDVFKRGDYKKIPVLTGFSNMEGISRTIKFGLWREMMNENFADFLPADLAFATDQSRDDFIKTVKKSYFKNEPVSAKNLEAYVDYFSDSMFKYSIMKSAKFHAARSPVYLYEFSYLGKLNMKHNYMDKLKGASHRDQTAYILDFFDQTFRSKDMDTRDRMTAMWADFVKYANPTAFESLLVDVKWLKFTNEDPNYMEISNSLRMKKDLFYKRYQFWDKIYAHHYWNPTASPKPSEINLNLTKKSETENDSTKSKPILAKASKNAEGEKVKIEPVIIKNIESKPISSVDEDEAKPTPTSNSETKAYSKKDVNSKPISTKDSETKPLDGEKDKTKPVTTKNTETKSVSADDSKMKPTRKATNSETKSASTKDGNIKPASAQDSNTKPTPSKNSETKSKETESKDSPDKNNKNNAKDSKTKDVPVENSKTEPVSNKNSRAKPASTKTSETKPNSAKSSESTAASAKASESKSTPTSAAGK